MPKNFIATEKGAAVKCARIIMKHLEKNDFVQLAEVNRKLRELALVCRVEGENAQLATALLAASRAMDSVICTEMHEHVL